MESMDSLNDSIRNVLESDDDMFEPKPSCNRPPSPFPEDVNHSCRLSQSNKHASSSGGGGGISSPTVSVRPPVAGLKKLKLNETAETGAIPKNSTFSTKIGDRQSGGSIFQPILRRTSKNELRRDANNKDCTTTTTTTKGKSPANSRPFFKSLASSAATVSASSSSNTLTTKNDDEDDSSQSLTVLFSSINDSDERLRNKMSHPVIAQSSTLKLFRHSDSDLDEQPVRPMKTYSFTKPKSTTGSSSSSSSTTIAPGQPTVESDRHSSGYGSDNEDAAGAGGTGVTGKKESLAAHASTSSVTTATTTATTKVVVPEIMEDDSVLILSSDDEVTTSRDVIAKPVTANESIMPNREVENATSSSSTSSIGRASSAAVNNSSARSMRSSSSPSVMTRSGTSGGGFSGTKRKRLGNVRTTGSNDSNQRQHNTKRNSNRPAASAHADSDSDDIQLLAAIAPFTPTASVELGDTTLNAIGQLEADEAFARQLQARYDAEVQQTNRIRMYNRLGQRPNYSRPPGRSRSPSLSPDSSSMDDGSRRRPNRHRNIDPPTFNSILMATLNDLSPIEPDRPPPPHGRRLNEGPNVGVGRSAARRNARLLDRFEPVGVAPRRGPFFDLMIPSRPGRMRRSSAGAFAELDALHRYRMFDNMVDYVNDFDFESLLDLADAVGEGRQGLKPEDIERLTTKKTYIFDFVRQESCSSSSSSTFEQIVVERETCSICMSDYDHGNELRILPCIHNFHKDCVDQWLKANTTCPICRIDVRQ